MAEQRVPRVPPGLERHIDGTQLMLSFKWNRSRGLKGLAVTLTGFVFLAGCVLYLVGAGSWFIVPALLLYVLTGLLWGVSSLADVLNVTTVRADLDLVNVTTGPIARGDAAGTTVRVEDLEHVFARQFRHGPNQHGELGHEVKATTRHGDDVMLVPGIRDRATATFIAQELARHLEIEG